MFDIKNAVEKSLGTHTTVPFLYWVVFPNIERGAWRAKWGKDSFEPPELLFKEDLVPAAIKQRLENASRDVFRRIGIEALDKEHLQHIARAFGDTSILYDEEREIVQTSEGTLGEYFDELAFQEKQLSDEQQRLAAQDWRGGPHLVRGVAGSGKTVVLAANLARLLERWQKEQLGLFESQGARQALAVCFNRTLVPFINRKVRTAFRQRTGGDKLPASAVTITHINGLMYDLSRAGLWEYQRVREEEGNDTETRARYYLAAIREEVKRGSPILQSLRFDAVYIDEGQDILEEEFQILADLCRTDTENGEPDLFVFYDDAQNLYGRARPTWEKLGLRMKGRAHVMKECFRNTRQIVEPAFNVLLGAAAPAEEAVHTRTFADTNYLEKEGVLEGEDDYWRVKFAERSGPWPEVLVSDTEQAEVASIISRIKWLLEEEKVRPEDILVLGVGKDRLRAIAKMVVQDFDHVKVILPFENENKDRYISRKGHVTISTVHSAKGYDAFCVLLVSANEFSTDVQGRASFYVACTRAREHLDVFAYENCGLVAELNAVLGHIAGKQ